MLTERERFDRCLAQILHHEGGEADHPKDPGGATMKGVTLAVFRTFKGNPNASKAELRAISDADLGAIYHRNYWLAASCDKLRPCGNTYRRESRSSSSNPLTPGMPSSAARAAMLSAGCSEIALW